MECTFAVEAPPPNGAAAAPGPAAASDQAGADFHAVLSALNPLQYVPVVGSIYRAATGDVPPEPVRVVGSFIAAALTGGPIGLAIGAAATVVEKLAGIDPDHIAHEMLESLGLVGPEAPAVASAGATDPGQAAAAATAYARTLGIETPAGDHA